MELKAIKMNINNPKNMKTNAKKIIKKQRNIKKDT